MRAVFRWVNIVVLAIWPNLAVKGTRQPQAYLKVGGFFGFAGFAVVLQAARPLCSGLHAV